MSDADRAQYRYDLWHPIQAEHGGVGAREESCLVSELSCLWQAADLLIGFPEIPHKVTLLTV